MVFILRGDGIIETITYEKINERTLTNPNQEFGG